MYPPPHAIHSPSMFSHLPLHLIASPALSMMMMIPILYYCVCTLCMMPALLPCNSHMVAAILTPSACTAARPAQQPVLAFTADSSGFRPRLQIYEEAKKYIDGYMKEERLDMEVPQQGIGTSGSRHHSHTHRHRKNNLGTSRQMLVGAVVVEGGGGNGVVSSSPPTSATIGHGHAPPMTSYYHNHGVAPSAGGGGEKEAAPAAADLPEFPTLGPPMVWSFPATPTGPAFPGFKHYYGAYPPPPATFSWAAPPPPPPPPAAVVAAEPAVSPQYTLPAAPESAPQPVAGGPYQPPAAPPPPYYLLFKRHW